MSPSFWQTMTPIMTPDPSPDAPTKRPLTAGIIVGVVGSIVLFVALQVACPSFTRTVCSASRQAPVLWLAGAMIALVAILAIALRWGMAFVLVCATTVLAGGAVTHGLVLNLWTAPFGALAHTARPIWTPVIERRALFGRSAQWVGTMSAQTLERIHGVRMAQLLQDCAESYRRADSLVSYPRTADELTTGTFCGVLTRDRIDLPGDTTRYSLAVDHGYRWSYVAGVKDAQGRVSSYSVRVEPDSLLQKPGPVYLGDESGLLRERASADEPPHVAASPVAFLLDIRPCVAQLDAERRSRKARLKEYYREPTAFEAAGSVCPDVASRLRRNEDGGSATVAFPIHEQRGEFLDTAAIYVLSYTPLDGTGANFELSATPMPTARALGGKRRYLLAGDGSLHVTGEARDATAEDSAPPPCEQDQKVACTP